MCGIGVVSCEIPMSQFGASWNMSESSTYLITGRFREELWFPKLSETFPKVSESSDGRSLVYVILTYGFGPVMSF